MVDDDDAAAAVLGPCTGIVQSNVSKTGQKMLPSGPPIQSLIKGSREISAKKPRMAATRSAVTAKLFPRRKDI